MALRILSRVACVARVGAVRVSRLAVDAGAAHEASLRVSGLPRRRALYSPLLAGPGCRGCPPLDEQPAAGGACRRGWQRRSQAPARGSGDLTTAHAPARPPALQHRLTDANNTEDTPFDFTEENYKIVKTVLAKYPKNYKQVRHRRLLAARSQGCGCVAPLRARRSRDTLA